ncbi:TonB-dependent receptor plug domain-containing protein [Sphingomonas flavalba]|uniref:TonB-dependent receptor plug domain-containing protein n=1 Tax=Sphingomonas flavalba TaxID=2559804 RepID=UPI0039E104F9
MPIHPKIRLAASVALIVATPGIAHAEQAGDPPGASSGEDVIVVTGTRAAGRTRLDSVSPVDVLTASTLRQQGTTEVAEALSSITPSIDFPRAAVVDGTDSVRPATLRGLSPDQTLVLINNVRGHSSALVNVNGSVGRGSSAVDLNTIPGVALDRIEVLRDGASAQYGSDAIAGVINLRLREARSGGGLNASIGQYRTTIDAARGSRDAHDGETFTISGWQGLALGQDGFLTLSAEYLNRNPTSRGDLDPRATPAKLRSRFGDPDVEQYTLYANAGVPLGEDWQLYGWGGYQHRDSVSAAFPRVPSNANNVASVYPDGFLPLIGVKSKDLTLAAGVRGDIGGWNLDLNVSYGRNRLDFSTLDSINATYGAASPTAFDDGALIYNQFITGLDLNREYGLGDGTLTVAAGVEYRREGYEIVAGQHESYDRGPLGGNTALASGAQGFIGFQPANEVDVSRDNLSAYLDVEAKFNDRLTIAAAIRGESYSDFGETATAKLSGRYDATDWFALRGAVSTGFRAPSLQQSFFTSTASVISNGNLLETGTYPTTSPIAAALGGRALDPEKSTNYSLGFVVRSGGFELTVDGYHIRIRDQLALSENIQASFSQAVADILAPFGVQAARFFINGVTTQTKGVDIVARYRQPTAGAGTFDFTLAANFSDIAVKKVPTTTSTLNPAPTLFNRQRILTIEQGTPRTKVVGSVDWSLGDLGVTGRATYYGDVNQPGTLVDGSADLHTGKKVIADLEARYTIAKRVTLAIGADNLFDTYPRQVPASLNSTGVTAFPFYSPFGFNGRFLYARVGVNW